MTTDVKLLPLPAFLPLSAAGARQTLEDYARANMAELLAENERLREEVRKVCADHKQVCCDYEGLRDILGSKLIKAEARAERLAEALREAADDLEREIDARIVVAQLRAAIDQARGKGGAGK